MALPYDYVFDPDIPPAPPVAQYGFNQKQVRFILSVLFRYQDVKWIANDGKVVELTDNEQKTIEDVYDELQSHNW